MFDTANRKRIRTREKVISFIQKNDDTISKYGSIEALKVQSNLYRTSRCNESKPAYNDYMSFMRRKKFIENNFHLYSVTTTTVSNEVILNETESGVVTQNENINNNPNEDEIEDENDDIRADGPNHNDQSNSNNNRERESEMLSYEESLNLKCNNCRRKQCGNLVNQYGSLFQMEMYRYVSYI